MRFNGDPADFAEFNSNFKATIEAHVYDDKDSYDLFLNAQEKLPKLSKAALVYPSVPATPQLGQH